ncbi:carbamoyl-phosphate synthase large subunit [Butyrivibrio hungatei DSM 14810]|uniref:Carbamoyl-phosphate synthase large subunit n=1 Tax=Butyrivibrio hungatei DSM 14810 TaxID=1121132 RepID=A0A1M7RZV7_9FIRM|nr:ATP-grasp domain-containing protein [Butyrivibrio hungatei]SHN51783.1 carbamoyl-phosphate synthase large subunit [Butyrivibrio hungatei DSM 14810]
MNILFCSVGRRCELLKDFRKTLGDKVRIVVTDNSPYAPALAFSDVSYKVPLITDENYIPMILDICKKEKINAITTLIDPEISILADHRAEFEALGVEVLAPYKETADLCFDKYEMFKYLSEKGVRTVKTYGTFEDFDKDYKEGKISLPVFVKPRTGSGSVGARRVESYELLKEVMERSPELIIQELMTGKDMDADLYVDTVSGEVIAIFSKKKISTTIGGANKTISFKDEKLFEFVKDAMKVFKFNGPLDMDLFFQNGEYYLSEINPRFGGAYLHAYGAGVDFPSFIYRNVMEKEANKQQIGQYDENVVMMMYDSVVIDTLDNLQERMKEV